MLAKSSSNLADNLEPARLDARAAGIHWPGRALMLLLNFVPLLHLLGIVLLLGVNLSWAWRISLALALLYLAPAILARMLLLIVPIQPGKIPLASRSFFVWWFLFQLQVIFCRLPALEEAMRLVPGLYSQWLRLWGSHIGRLTYWSAGTLITDRSFLEIGDNVVFGAGVRLNAHVLTRGAVGQVELLLAPVNIGDRSIIGGYSLLTAGTRIAADEVTRAFLVSPPFSAWEKGKRIRAIDDEGGND